VSVTGASSYWQILLNLHKYPGISYDIVLIATLIILLNVQSSACPLVALLSSSGEEISTNRPYTSLLLTA